MAIFIRLYSVVGKIKFLKNLLFAIFSIQELLTIKIIAIYGGKNETQVVLCQINIFCHHSWHKIQRRRFTQIVLKFKSQVFKFWISEQFVNLCKSDKNQSSYFGLIVDKNMLIWQRITCKASKLVDPIVRAHEHSHKYTCTIHLHRYYIYRKCLKVRKFHNENTNSSHCPKYERKN